MRLPLLLVATLGAMAFSFASCHSVEAVGALKVAGETMEGKPLVPTHDIPAVRPNTGHIPEVRPASGLLHWRSR